MAEKSEEMMKKELESFAKTISEKDDNTFESINQAVKLLCSLNDFKRKFKPQSDETTISLSETGIPMTFYCPLSGHLMHDPVLLSSGETYERKFIEIWLRDAYHQTCPQTERHLLNTFITPNLIAREIISEWHTDHELPFPPPDDFETFVNTDREYLNTLLHKISDSSDDVSAQKEGVQELLVLITKQKPYSRVLFGEIQDSIALLLSPLSKGHVHTTLELHQNLLTILYKLSVHESNKRLITESSIALPIIIKSLTSGTIETRRYAAASLLELSSLHTNKIIILETQALKSLFSLLEDAHPFAMKDTISAIRNLCKALGFRDKEILASSRAIPILMRKLKYRYLIDDSLAILEILSTSTRAIEEMAKIDGVSCLLNILNEILTESSQNNCLRILHTMCSFDRNMLREIKVCDEENGIIHRVIRSGYYDSRITAEKIKVLIDRYNSGIV